MSLKKLCFAASIALLAATPAHAGEELLFGPAPEWVEPLPPAAEPADQSTLPVRVLRMDLQTRMEGGRQTTYSAITFKIQSSQGLDAGNLSLPWRPETDDLTIHRIAIRRGAETIDVLASGQTFTTLRREQNLEQATLDGVLTANLFPEDLQVGDILEIVTSLTSSDPVFAGHSEQLIGPLNASIDHLHVRLMWPSALRMRLAKTEDLPSWRKSKKDGYEIAELDLENLEPIPTPRDAPLRYGMVRFIQASNFATWADLAATQAPLYEKASQVPGEGLLRTEIERIRQSSSDPVKQTEAALQLVQRRVRYVALAMGEGGYVPADATLTWSRRFGDCKGKTALLLAILGELGIEAEAVLANTVLGDSLPGRLPSVGAFDHVLVRATIGGRPYWLDGTRTGDTTLDRLTIPYFDWGLPLRASGAELVEMMPAPLAEPSSDIAIHMDATQGIRAPVPTKIELVLRGDQAVGMNLDLAGQVGAARDRALREFWRQRFNSVEPDSVGAAYDEGARELRLTLDGKATLEWNGVWYQTDETGVGYHADFSREPGLNSDAPYSVGFPYFTRTRETFVLPPTFAGPTGGDDDVDETVAGVEYRRQVTMNGNTLTIEETERSIVPEFPSRDAPAFERRLRELSDNAVYLRIPNSYRPTEADVAAILANPGENANDLVSQGNELINGGRNDEALAVLGKATELDARNATAWADRGVAFLNKNMTEEATASFERAASIDPRNVVVFNGRGRMAENRLDAESAIAAFSQALEVDPRNIFALNHRARAYMATDHADQALADVEASLKLNPRQIEVHSFRAFIHVRAGRPEQAEAAVEEMVAVLQDDPAALAVASQIYNDLGVREKARALADRAVEGNPTAPAFYNRARARDPSDVDGQLSDLNEAIRLFPAYQPALLARATLLYENNRFEDALADTAEALRVTPQWPEANLLRANIFNRMGRREDAIAEAAAVIAANPDDAWAHVAAGKIYAQFGRRAEALAAINRGIEMDEQPLYYIDRAQVREPADWDGRMADVEQALRLAPKDTSALYMKAALLTEKSDRAAAVEVFSEVAEAEPENPGPLNDLGIALVRAGRVSEAEHDFAEARSLAKDAMSLNNLCYPKAVANVALERALEECDESLRLLPDFAATLDSRGAVLLRLGRLDEAIRDFDRVLEQSPGYTNSRYLRAVARSRKGEQAAAQADLAIVRRDNPTLEEWMVRNDFVISDKAEGAAE